MLVKLKGNTDFSQSTHVHFCVYIIKIYLAPARTEYFYITLNDECLTKESYRAH